jgi:glycosyltransferase involved in cell wall biosynthesis
MKNQSAMRVLFITGSAAAGGGPRHLLDWLEALHKYAPNNVQIFVAAPDHGLFADPLRSIAAETLTIPERAISLFRLFSIYRFARRNKINLVHSFGRAGGIYGRFLGLFGFTVMHTPQGLISTPFNQFVYDSLEFFLRSVTKKYVFGSQSEADQGETRFGVKDGLIVPPVVMAPESALQNDLQDRCGEALTTGRPLVLGTIGRFVPHKRVLNLTRAIMALGPGFQLRLYGEGGDLLQLEKLAKASEGRVVVRGLVDRWQALSEIDVFVSWSKSESFGLAAAEAMAMGVPCLLSDVLGHRDLAGNEQRAWLFQSKSKSAFSRVLAELLRDKNDRKSRVERARAAINSLCHPERIARDLLAAYRMALGENS